MSGVPNNQHQAYWQTLDLWLLGSAVALLMLGLVMVMSASVSVATENFSNPFHYFFKQMIFVIGGMLLAAVVLTIPTEYWQRAGWPLLLLSLVLLSLVLIPGIGKTVNGSSRWLAFGPLRLQASEVAKLFLLVYLADYLVRHADVVRTRIRGFLRPLLMLCLAGFLLLLEPDFGAAAILLLTSMGMMFLGGVRFWQFFLLSGAMASAGVALIVTSPYRMQRLTAFLDPWADPFDSGFQLTQSLIAVGSGAMTGTGLGGSVQKLFYLPEAHTDFLFAVLAEELGLVGVIAVLVLYGVLVWRAFSAGNAAAQAGSLFGAYVAGGIGVWLGLQAAVNIAVNMGVLPTKGLTLPLLSAGGTSTVVLCVAIGLLLRIGHESHLASVQALRKRSRRMPA